MRTVILAGCTTPIGAASSYESLHTSSASRGYNDVFSPEEGELSLNIVERFDASATSLVSEALIQIGQGVVMPTSQSSKSGI